MPERIFPTKSQDQLGSKLEFNGIDIDTLVTRLAESQDDKKSTLSPELLEKIAQMKLNIVTSEEDDDESLEGAEDLRTGGSSSMIIDSPGTRLERSLT